MLNSNFIKGKWEELKGDVRQAWGKLTEDEVEKTKGDIQALAGLIQQKYGMAQEEARNKVNEFFRKFSSDSTPKSKNEKDRAS